MIIFLAFSVILVTLVLQGLTLPSLIRALGLAGGPQKYPEENEARRTILEAALKYLDEIRDHSKPGFAEVYDDLSQHYRSHLATLNEDGEGAQDGRGTQFYYRYLEVSRKLLKIERDTAVQLRNQRRISDEFLREVERELDLGEARLIAKHG